MRRSLIIGLSILVVAAIALVVILTSESDEDKYVKAQKLLNERRYDKAIAAFEELSGFEESAKFIMYCKCLAQGDAGEFELAINNLIPLSDFKEARFEIAYYEARALERSAQYERAQAKYQTILMFRDSAERCAALPDLILERDLRVAVSMMNFGDYTGAIELLARITAHPEAEAALNECHYQLALIDEANGNIRAACKAFAELADHADCKQRLSTYETAYAAALKAFEAGEYAFSATAFGKLNDYSDSVRHAMYAQACIAMDETKPQWLAIERAFGALGDFKDSAVKSVYCRAKSQISGRNYAYALELLRGIPDYKDTNEAIYQIALAYEESGGVQAACDIFSELGDYADCLAKLTKYANSYAAALKDLEKGWYVSAANKFEALKDYAESALYAEYAAACDIALMNAIIPEAEVIPSLLDAAARFERLGDFKDSASKAAYTMATMHLTQNDYAAALDYFRKIIDYADVRERVYYIALEREQSGGLQFACDAYSALGDYLDSADRLRRYESYFQNALSLFEANQYQASIPAFEALTDYNESDKYAVYARAMLLSESGEHAEANALFSTIPDFLDSILYIMAYK